MRESTRAMSDNPSRYSHGNIECIDAIKSALTRDEFIGFCKGNIVKYLWRERYKGKIVDVEKAASYLEWLHDAMEEE